MKKVLLTLATLALVISGASATVGATGDRWDPPAVPIEKCGNTSVHYSTSDKVTIVISNSDESITVTTKTGYSLVSVYLDIEHDNQGYILFPQVVNGVKFTPGNEKEIDSAKVTVKKECKEVCNDPTALNYEKVVEGQTVANNKLCKYSDPVTTPAPTTPTVTTTTATPQVAATPVKAVAAGSGGGATSASASIVALVASVGTMAYGALRFRKFNV